MKDLRSLAFAGLFLFVALPFGGATCLYAGMTARMRRYFAGVMVAVLVLTGHSMAIARGMPGTAGYAELCLSETAVMVAVDADGAPVGPSHVCPEISFSLLAALAVETPAPVAVLGRSTPLRFSKGTFKDVIRPVSRSARAPPFDFV